MNNLSKMLKRYRDVSILSILSILEKAGGGIRGQGAANTHAPTEPLGMPCAGMPPDLVRLGCEGRSLGAGMAGSIGFEGS